MFLLNGRKRVMRHNFPRYFPLDFTLKFSSSNLHSLFAYAGLLMIFSLFSWSLRKHAYVAENPSMILDASPRVFYALTWYKFGGDNRDSMAVVVIRRISIGISS